MVKNRTPKGTVIDFAKAQKQAQPKVRKAAGGGGFLDTWLKGHEDSQALVRENLSLKAQQRLLEEERQSLVPRLGENLLYYVSLILAIGSLFGLIMLAY